MNSNPWRGADPADRVVFDGFPPTLPSSSQQNLFPIGDRGPRRFANATALASLPPKTAMMALARLVVIVTSHIKIKHSSPTHQFLTVARLFSSPLT